MFESSKRPLQQGILCLGLILASFTQSYGQAIDEVVLIVDDQAITAREFSVLHVMHDQSKPYQLVQPRIGEPVTDAIVDEMLLAVHAKRLVQSATVSQAQVDAAITTLAAQNKLAANQLLSQLQSQGVDIQIFKDSMRQRLLVQKIVGQRVARSVKVSDSEIQDYIESRPELRAQTQKKYLASHILIPYGDASSREKKSLAKVALEIRKQLSEGASFAEVIASRPEVQANNPTGELGWKQKDELPKLFVDTLEALSTGEISAVIESENGFHVLALHEVALANASEKEYHIRHILKAIPQGGDPSQIAAHLQNLKLQALAGVDFATLARSESQDTTSAKNGGDIGWLKLQQLDPEIVEVLQNLEVGQISDPIRTKYGLHIIQLQDSRVQAGAQNLERRVQQQIFSEKVDEKMEDLLNDLRQVALIEVVS